MAQIRNKQYFTLNRDAWGNKREVPVRNNGKVHFHPYPDNGYGKLVCTLHNHPIVEFSRNPEMGVAVIRLDACGWYTTTTRQAMNDYLTALGVQAGVSISPKNATMHVRYCVDGEWREYDAHGGEAAFTVPLWSVKA